MPHPLNMLDAQANSKSALGQLGRPIKLVSETMQCFARGPQSRRRIAIYVLAAGAGC